MSQAPKNRQRLSLEEMSDRFLIQDLVIEEAAAIDERDWDRWEATYVADAKIGAASKSSHASAGATGD